MTKQNLWENKPAMAAQWPIWGLLRDARNRSGMNLESLADKAGISVEQLEDFEQARVLPSVEMLYTIINACGLEMCLQLTKPDAQVRSMRTAARSRTIEERIAVNESALRTVKEFRKGAIKKRPVADVKVVEQHG
jgi:transcriptional regulator with XRE-family HTH domain